MECVKWKPFIDYEKEESWLNHMSQQGWHLKQYTWCRYVFERGEPGKYIYRLEFLKNLPGHSESLQYIQFLEDSGIEVVSTYFRWIFMRRPAELGAFDVFSDISSKIEHYKKIRLLLGIVCFFNLYIGITNSLHWSSYHADLSLASRSMPLINVVLGLLILPYVYKLTMRIRNLRAEEKLHE